MNMDKSEWKIEHAEHMKWYKMIVAPDRVFNPDENGTLTCECGSRYEDKESES